MRRSNMLVFDEYLSASTTLTTNQELNGPLAQYDQMGVFVIVDNTVGGTLTVGLFHSGDGRNWPQKGSNLIGTGGLSGSFGAGTTPLVAYDNGTTPSLALVQLQITTTVAAHVRIHVTFRDPSQ